MTSQDLFWTKIAPKYAKSPVADVPAYEHTLARTRNYLHADDSVLEIGCGTGSTALRLADHVHRIVATDFAQGMIRIASDKAVAAGNENVDFRVADTTLADFETDSFDAVLAFNLFHLVPDLEGAMSRTYDVLKPGGYMISKTVCMGGSWVIPIVIKSLQFVGKAPFVAMITPDHLQAAIRWAGFDIVETADHNKQTRGHFIVARKPD